MSEVDLTKEEALKLMNLRFSQINAQKDFEDFLFFLKTKYDISQGEISLDLAKGVLKVKNGE